MTETQRQEQLTRPTPALVAAVRTLQGDIMVLGAGGKMGPSLVNLLQRTISENRLSKHIFAVSRFSDPDQREACSGDHTTIMAGNLLDEAFLDSLPQVENVIYLVGHKFGSNTQPDLTWALNAYLPGRIASKFRTARTVAFSTGNVYPLMPVAGTGATEQTPPDPIGEYAQSCLGRERVFSYFSKQYHTPTLIFRLNYAHDLRYGVLNDIGRSVWQGLPIDLGMSHVNVIWQGDANAYAVQCLHHCTVPATILNVTGRSKLSVQNIAQKFGQIFDKPVHFSGRKNNSALLSDASQAIRLLGPLRISEDQLIEWSAQWIRNDGTHLDKPTHFQERKGKF